MKPFLLSACLLLGVQDDPLEVPSGLYAGVIITTCPAERCQTISTEIKDRAHPGEPWVVTTHYREPADTERHRDTVEAVRETLGGD